MKNKKPHLIFIYGFIAVGKLTIAKKLTKLTKYKLLHNHLIVDFIENLFGNKRPGTAERAEAIQWVSFGLIKRLLKKGDDIIFTHTYSKSYIYRNGMTDIDFVKEIEKITTESGGIFCPIYLSCNEEEMLVRVKNESRKSHGKLRSIKIMRELMKKEDFKIPAPLKKNNLIIDTTKNSPEKIVKIIKEHFNLN